MNKLYVENERVLKQELDDALEIETSSHDDFFSVNHIIIKVLEDTELYIEYNASEKVKLNIEFETNPNVHLRIFEVRTGEKPKVQYQYKLEENSSIDSIKFYDAVKMREFDIVELNGTGATFRMNLKTVATVSEKYDMMIYHNASNTHSTIINQGVSTQKGDITFNVTGIIPNGKKGCTCHEQNRIINLNNGKNKISPNLLIDEYDVEADHSADIGTFSDDEIFYLESRGLKKDEAISLLTNGFLKSYESNEFIQEQIEKCIHKYWG